MNRNLKQNLNVASPFFSYNDSFLLASKEPGSIKDMFHFVFSGLDFAHKLDEKQRPTENYEKHLHYFHEIVYFVRGKVNYNVEGESKKLHNGDLVFIEAGRNHFAEVNLDDCYERYVLKFDSSLLPPYLQNRIGEIRTFHNLSPIIAGIINGLDLYVENHSKEETFILLESELQKLLVFLLCDKKEIAGEYDENIAQIIEWIDLHIEEPISLKRIASIFHYSSSQICNAFKKNVKMPLMRMVKAKKLIAARKAIERGEKKNEVALRYSFENYSTFYRLYVKAFRESPSGKKID